MRGFPAILMAVGLIACSDGERSQLLGARGSDTQGTEPFPPGGGPGDHDGDGVVDPGPSFAGDAGADSSSTTAPPTDPFSGAPAYVATLGPSARKPGHSQFNAQNNPAGRPCFNCHDGNGNAPEFTVAGTVYLDLAGTMPAPRVEIRVLDEDGKAVSVYSDNDGNFFLPLNPNGALSLPILAGARKANGTRTMLVPATNGNCNSCHRAGGAAGGRLFMP